MKCEDSLEWCKGPGIEDSCVACTNKHLRGQIQMLADYLLEDGDIQEGGTVDNAIRMLKERPLPSEVLYMFMGWITTRKESVMLGAQHSTSLGIELIDAYIKANEWKTPREGFELTIKHPE